MCAGACPPSAHYMAVTTERYETAAYSFRNTSSCYYRCFRKPSALTELCKNERKKKRREKGVRERGEKPDSMHLNWSGEMQEASPPLTHSSWMSLLHH